MASIKTISSGELLVACVRAEARFWSFVRRGDGCWEWTGRVDKDGYGDFTISFPPTTTGKQRQIHIRAHRVSFLIAHGAVPELLVLHSCDNPPCVRPDHLTEGTQLKNRRDAMNRNRVARGERHGRAKLTEAQVLELRKRRAAGEHLPTLAKEFGIGESTVYQVTSGFHWKHLEASS